jgi:drug/metabolite transporter (DMT)-like permease
VKDQRRATAFGLAAVVIWSTVASAFKLALRSLDTYQLLLVATAFSLISLTVVLAWQRRLGQLIKLPAADRWRALALGILNPFIYYLVLFAAYDRLPAQVAQPINYTWALTLSWLSIPLLGQKPRLRDLLAGLVCYAGVVVIATEGDLSSFHVADPLGVGLALFSTVLWALFWIANTRSKVDPVVGLWWNFAGALPLILITVIVMSDLRLPSSGALIATYVGAFEMGFTFVLWLTAMKLAKVTARVANLIFLSPFLSLILIHFVLGEHVRVATFGGLVLIVGGLVWQQAGNRQVDVD